MTTMLQTLDETVGAYTSETRAITGYDPINAICHYFIDGKCCAIGRCLEDPEKFQNANMSVLFLDAAYDLELILKPEYRGFPIDFGQLSRLCMIV